MFWKFIRASLIADVHEYLRSFSRVVGPVLAMGLPSPGLSAAMAEMHSKRDDLARCARSTRDVSSEYPRHHSELVDQGPGVSRSGGSKRYVRCSADNCLDLSLSVNVTGLRTCAIRDPVATVSHVAWANINT